MTESPELPASSDEPALAQDAHRAWIETRGGKSALERGAAAADLIASLKFDEASQSAARLSALTEKEASAASIHEAFGEEVAELVHGMRYMAIMQGLTNQGKLATGAKVIASASAGASAGIGSTAGLNHAANAQQTESLRKMLLAMVGDVRVVFIKLAERLAALRAAALSPSARRNERAQAEARDVMDIFAPLANRLGVWQFKWELEDLSLRILAPDRYHEIARYLDETRVEREAYITTTKTMIRSALADSGVKGEISGRPKHIYSIYEKLNRKRCTIEDLFDIRAVRIIVPELKDCYAALGIVHSLFQPIPGEFDDYIAKPKANNYRSLHTGVMGPQNKALEIQIRSQEMHQMSEFGVAAHWNYKEGGEAARDASFANKIAHLRQLLTWGNEVSSPGELLAGFKSSLFDETIFVLTPQGKIIDLPKDSTPVDFAYTVHTNLGHRCRGAKVDGVMVPLSTPLKNGQRVEIIAIKEGGPSRDWLNPDSGYLRSSRARGKVRQWFNALDTGETLTHGRAVVTKDLQRHGQTALNLDRLAQEAGFKSQDEFFTAVGRAEFNTRELDIAIKKAAGIYNETIENPDASEIHASRSKAKASSGGILVVGVDKLMTGLAKCCSPVPPDSIVGFVTKLKGITIHRADCSNVRRMAKDEPRRIIEADWGDTSKGDVFSVQIDVFAQDRQGLLRDISDVLAREKINVTAVNTQSRDFVAKMKFTAEVKSNDQLQHALVIVAQIKGVLEAVRG